MVWRKCQPNQNQNQWEREPVYPYKTCNHIENKQTSQIDPEPGINFSY